MKRVPRHNYNDAGHAHELTFSCYHRLPLLESDQICRWLAESVNEAKARLQFHVWAYVFMPEHVHLIVYPELPAYDIARIRSSIKEPVGRRAMNHFQIHRSEWLPQLERQRGQRRERLFWQSGGGYDRNIVEPATLVKAIDYIHLNPVRRGLVQRAIDWKWSSAPFLIGDGKSPVILDPIPSWWFDAP